MQGVPIRIGRGAEGLFGWFHPPEGPARRCGVVVCSPIGDEQLRAHRTLRHLAARLQRLGFPVLRFDFHGTGDSPGDERDPDRVRTWLSDVGRAVDELQARGASRICLFGMRMGATLAMAAAAERGGVESLVLWSPFLSGKAFVVDSVKQHKMQKLLLPEGFAAEPKGWNPGGEQALGFLLTPSTRAALEGVDLFTVGKPARRALLVGDGDAGLLEHLQMGGVEAEHHPDSNKFLFMSTFKASVPEPAIDRVATWLVEGHPDVEAGLRVPTVEIENANENANENENDERPIHFGAEGALFGVLHHPPPSLRDPARPAILVLNAGTTHRVGPHRLNVKMARHWAKRGFFALRLDLSGIGDSPAPAGCDENLCYPRDALADVRAAMQALGDQLAVERFVLVGLCSGGDLTFHIALAEPKVTGAVIMNPLTFCVHDQSLVESYQPAGYYAGSLVDGAKLKRLVRGEVDLAGAIGGALRNVASIARRRRERHEVSGGLNDVPALLRRLAGRGVETLLVAGTHDPGVVYVDHHFGDGMRALGAVPHFRRVELPGTDHTFTSLYAQELLLDSVTRHLEERHR